MKARPNRITAVEAGIDVRSDPLGAHYLAGGDVNHMVLVLIAADKEGWWNWQTRTFAGRMPKGLRVQVPPRAPLLTSVRCLLGNCVRIEEPRRGNVQLNHGRPVGVSALPI